MIHKLSLEHDYNTDFGAIGNQCYNRIINIKISTTDCHASGIDAQGHNQTKMLQGGLSKGSFRLSSWRAEFEGVARELKEKPEPRVKPE